MKTHLRILFKPLLGLFIQKGQKNIKLFAYRLAAGW
jgi:hypothetical protein